MSSKTKVGIIICHRYRRCAGGKCLRAMRNREGAFSVYCNTDLELVGYTTCDGCPGGNVEYAGDEMVKNGAQVIHLATGLVVGYPPCPYLHTFKTLLEARHGVRVVVGTHPIPAKYLEMHRTLGTWEETSWQPILEPTMADEATRKAYDQAVSDYPQDLTKAIDNVSDIVVIGRGHCQSFDPGLRLFQAFSTLLGSRNELVRPVGRREEWAHGSAPTVLARPGLTVTGPRESLRAVAG